MEKTIFIINGRGGVGKDTICEMAGKLCRVRNVSSITPIVEIARYAGWDGVKTPEARRLLSRLKEAFTEFNDLSHQYCLKQVADFLEGEERLLFLHVREPEEIERLKRELGSNCRTLLVRRKGISGQLLGNRSDDEVETFQYDVVLENDSDLKALEEKVGKIFAEFRE